jgi:hypothetical protein
MYSFYAQAEIFLLRRLAALYLAQRAIKTREAVDLTLRLALPDLVFPGGDSLVAMRGGLLTAKSTVSGAGPPSAGAVDRCDVVWSGIGCVACGKEEDWKGMAEGGGHGFSIPEVKICMLVAADRSDMSMTQLSVEQVLSRFSATLSHTWCLHISVSSCVLHLCRDAHLAGHDVYHGCRMTN